VNEFKDIEYKINIKNIKNSFIKKDIFSFLNDKQQLNMIIYNKELQKMLSFDIKDYKNVSDKYKIGEKNGKGKEYLIDTNDLVFEGEYLNGKKNGKGKEYYIGGKLEFEGEYLNGKRNSKGEEYHINGKKIFEGEYSEGERNGKGKEFDYRNGEIIFDGEYLKNKRWIGKVNEYYSNGQIMFKGEYLNGKRWNGKGYNKNGKIEFEIKKGNGKAKEYDLTVII